MNAAEHDKDEYETYFGHPPPHHANGAKTPAATRIYHTTKTPAATRIHHTTMNAAEHDKDEYETYFGHPPPHHANGAKTPADAGVVQYMNAVDQDTYEIEPMPYHEQNPSAMTAEAASDLLHHMSGFNKIEMGSPSQTPHVVPCQEVVAYPSSLPGLGQKLKHLSKDQLIGRSMKWVEIILLVFPKKEDKETLLKIYEMTMNLPSTTKILGLNDGPRNKKELQGHLVYSKRASLEGIISSGTPGFRFASLLHFALFYIANDGYHRIHRPNPVGSCSKRLWNKLPKDIKDGYTAIGKMINTA
jgi:hypothetical protein